MSSSSNLLHSSPHSTPSPLSSTCSTPRNIRSLLNQGSPKNSPIPLSASLEEDTRPLRKLRRGHSTSDLVQPFNLTDHPIVRVTSTDDALSSSTAFSDGMTSTFRERSRSPLSSERLARNEKELPSENADHPLTTSWWGTELHVARPWHDPPNRKKTVPPEQTQALQNTQKVSNNIVSVKSANCNLSIVSVAIHP